MKYLCFGYYDKGKFDGMTESKRNAMFDTCFKYDDHLEARDMNHAVQLIAQHAAMTYGNIFKIRPTRMISFGNFSVDSKARELLRGGKKIRPSQQGYSLLAALIESPGELVSRETIRRKIWTGNTFVDFESGINKTASELRVVLGDRADEAVISSTLIPWLESDSTEVSGRRSSTSRARIAIRPKSSNPEFDLDPAVEHFGFTPSSNLGGLDPGIPGATKIANIVYINLWKRRAYLPDGRAS